MTEHQLPIFYIVDSNGNEQKIELSKLRIELQDGNNVTIKVGICNPERSQQIIVTGHRGCKEDEVDDKCGVLIKISPASGNVVFIKPESYKRNSKPYKNSDV